MKRALILITLLYSLSFATDVYYINDISEADSFEAIVEIPLIGRDPIVDNDIFFTDNTYLISFRTDTPYVEISEDNYVYIDENISAYDTCHLSKVYKIAHTDTFLLHFEHPYYPAWNENVPGSPYVCKVQFNVSVQANINGILEDDEKYYYKLYINAIGIYHREDTIYYWTSTSSGNDTIIPYIKLVPKYYTYKIGYPLHETNFSEDPDTNAIGLKSKYIPIFDVAFDDSLSYVLYDCLGKIIKVDRSGGYSNIIDSTGWFSLIGSDSVINILDTNRSVTIHSIKANDFEQTFDIVIQNPNEYESTDNKYYSIILDNAEPTIGDYTPEWMISNKYYIDEYITTPETDTGLYYLVYKNGWIIGVLSSDVDSLRGGAPIGLPYSIEGWKILPVISCRIYKLDSVNVKKFPDDYEHIDTIGWYYDHDSYTTPPIFDFLEYPYVTQYIAAWNDIETFGPIIAFGSISLISLDPLLSIKIYDSEYDDSLLIDWHSYDSLIIGMNKSWFLCKLGFVSTYNKIPDFVRFKFDGVYDDSTLKIYYVDGPYLHTLYLSRNPLNLDSMTIKNVSYLFEACVFPIDVTFDDPDCERWTYFIDTSSCNRVENDMEAHTPDWENDTCWSCGELNNLGRQECFEHIYTNAKWTQVHSARAGFYTYPNITGLRKIIREYNLHSYSFSNIKLYDENTYTLIGENIDSDDNPMLTECCSDPSIGDDITHLFWGPYVYQYTCPSDGSAPLCWVNNYAEKFSGFMKPDSTWVIIHGNPCRNRHMLVGYKIISGPNWNIISNEITEVGVCTLLVFTSAADNIECIFKSNSFNPPTEIPSDARWLLRNYHHSDVTCDTIVIDDSNIKTLWFLVSNDRGARYLGFAAVIMALIHNTTYSYPCGNYCSYVNIDDYDKTMMIVAGNTSISTILPLNEKMNEYEFYNNISALGQYIPYMHDIISAGPSRERSPHPGLYDCYIRYYNYIYITPSSLFDAVNQGFGSYSDGMFMNNIYRISPRDQLDIMFNGFKKMRIKR